MDPRLTPGIDVTLLVFYAFVLFFVGLVFYLRREDRREGYPLEEEATGHLFQNTGPLGTSHIKRFRLPFGRGTVITPTKGREPVVVAGARKRENFPGAPLSPTGNPLVDGVGPAAWANRAKVPDLDMEGLPRIVPISVAKDYSISARDIDPRGLPVVAADGRVAGTVDDLWIDRSDRLIRYLHVATPAGRSVLVPMAMSTIDKRRRRVTIDAITAAQFADAPIVGGEGTLTFYDEERVQAYFGGGYLYASRSRQEPYL